MPLYVSDSAELHLHVRDESVNYTVKGDVAGKSPRLFAQFHRGGIPDWAREYVFSRLDYRGLPDGLPKEMRTGTFDSEIAQQDFGWSDEERKLVEESLDKHMPGNNYLKLEMPAVDAPWPNITKLTVIGRRTMSDVVEQLFSKCEEDGYDIDGVIMFVQQEKDNVTGWDDRLVAMLRERRTAQSAGEPAEELVEA